MWFIETLSQMVYKNSEIMKKGIDNFIGVMYNNARRLCVTSRLSVCKWVRVHEAAEKNGCFVEV